MDKPQRSPVVTIVGFHHARGPEVETWIGLEREEDISDWPLLPFLALADGAHASEEDFSYFTLKHTTPTGPTTLFGISCTRQLDASQLADKPADVTRSTVQKAVVVIADSPTFFFSHLKQQLSAVTTAWFAQRNFEDLDIIRKFQESLKTSIRDYETDRSRDQFVGLSLREFVYEFKHQTLILFKCALLQPKMLFFGSSCERLCMTQFSLLSLIPGLLRNLEDCGDPDMNTYESKLKKPTSVKTSDRKSLLNFMGLPLQIFGKGSLFGPYTPLQQLDVLADFGTKSYVVGSTNSLLLQQRDRYSDILINLDDKSINITSSSLRAALSLSAADRRWIDVLVQSVSESWDESDPTRPKTMGFTGSEDYIRLQFEEYILSMVSSVKYHLFLEKHAGSESNLLLPDIDGDPANDFQMDWVDAWKKTENFRIFQKFTDSELFDLVPPKHVMAGGLTMEDVQRRILQQMQELRLEEKVQNSKEALAKTLANGRVNVSTVFNNLSKNVEKFREQRKSQSQDSMQKLSIETGEKPSTDSNPSTAAPSTVVSPVLADASSRAGAYFSSWAAWAGEKRKKFVQMPTSPPSEPVKGDGSDRPLSNPLPADPLGSFEEATFDSRSRAVYASSSGRSSPQRASVSSNATPASMVIKDLDKGKGIGLGIVDAGLQSPPVPPKPFAEEKKEPEPIVEEKKLAPLSQPTPAPAPAPAPAPIVEERKRVPFVEEKRSEPVVREKSPIKREEKKTIPAEEKEAPVVEERGPPPITRRKTERAIPNETKDEIEDKEAQWRERIARRMERARTMEQGEDRREERRARRTEEIAPQAQERATTPTTPGRVPTPTTPSRAPIRPIGSRPMPSTSRVTPEPTIVNTGPSRLEPKRTSSPVFDPARVARQHTRAESTASILNREKPRVDPSRPSASGIPAEARPKRFSLPRDEARNEARKSLSNSNTPTIDNSSRSAFAARRAMFEKK